MKTATVTWDLPPDRVNGTPLSPSNVVTDVFLSANAGADFTLLPPSILGTDTQVKVIPDLIDGDYIVRLVIRDTSGLESDPVDTPFTVVTEPVSSPPNPVQNVQVTFS